WRSGACCRSRTRATTRCGGSPRRSRARSAPTWWEPTCSTSARSGSSPSAAITCPGTCCRSSSSGRSCSATFRGSSRAGGRGARCGAAMCRTIRASIAAGSRTCPRTRCCSCPPSRAARRSAASSSCGGTPGAGYRVPPGRLAAFREFRVSLLKHAFYAQAARTRRPVFTSDAMHDSRIPATIREQGPHRSQLFVPVVVKDRMIGAFAAVWWETPREFSEDEIALMEAIANQAGVALENGRLFEENRQRLEELLVLHDLSRAVTGQLERGAVVDAVRRHIARVLDARNLV